MGTDRSANSDENTGTEKRAPKSHHHLVDQGAVCRRQHPERDRDADAMVMVAIESRSVGSSRLAISGDVF